MKTKMKLLKKEWKSLLVKISVLKLKDTENDYNNNNNNTNIFHNFH